MTTELIQGVYSYYTRLSFTKKQVSFDQRIKGAHDATSNHESEVNNMQAISFVSGIIQACCQFERTNACCKREWICRENKYLQVSKLLNIMLKKK